MAKQLTKQEMHKMCMEVVDRLAQTEREIIEIAADLYRIRQLRYYSAGWDSFEEYCMEFKNMSYSKVTRLIDIYITFVLKHKIAPAQIAQAGGWTKIADVLPLVKTKEDAKRWLEEAANTPNREALRQTIREAKANAGQADCTHKNTYVLRICTDCGLKERLVESPIKPHRHQRV